MTIRLQVAQGCRRQFAPYLIREFFGKIFIKFRPPLPFYPVHLFLSRRVCGLAPVPLSVESGGGDDMVVDLRK